MTKLSLRIAPVALAVLLVAPAAAFAQSTPAPTAPATPSMPPTTSAPSAAAPGTQGESLMTRVDQRINELHAQLHITQAQEGQWHKFAQVMRSNAREMDAAVQQRAEKFDTMTAVQNMQSYAKLAEAHAEHMKRLVRAFDNLYNILPESQRKLADNVFRARAEAHAQQHAAGAKSH